MMRKWFSIGLISATCFVGLCDTSEAGHRHRRARNARGHTSVDLQNNCYTSANYGYANDAYSGYGHATTQSYGSSSYGSNHYPSYVVGDSSVYGNYGVHGGQVHGHGNVGGNVIGNNTVLGR